MAGPVGLVAGIKLGSLAGALGGAVGEDNTFFKNLLPIFLNPI